MKDNNLLLLIQSVLKLSTEEHVKIFDNKETPKDISIVTAEIARVVELEKKIAEAIPEVI